MWRKMRWFKGYRQTKKFVSDDKQKLLLDSLAPDSVVNVKPNFQSHNDLLEMPFTMPELLNCLRKKDTAPGDDEVTYSMVYYLPREGKTILLHIYNTIFTSGLVLRQWRTILIIPIPKLSSTQSSTNTEQKLRLISLISCLCKILHTMICKKLEWYTEKQCILSPYTSGFRRGQSCLDCLARLITYVQTGLTNNIPTVACFLDIENAYNNVLIEKVVGTLDELNVGSKVCNYVWSFLSDRCLMIKNNKSVYTRWTTRGLAQGDPLSSLLFNLTTYNLCRQFETTIKVSQYADDFLFYVSNKNLNICEQSLQSALNTMVVMLSNLGLELSDSKSMLCIFSRGRRRNLINVKVHGRIIKQVENIKYLGMWLDRSLLWNRHIKETTEKTFRYLNVLKVLAGPSWGVHPKYLRTLYISLIRSRIDFGCFLYDTSAKVH